MKFIQLVIGPAGVGKSSYCKTIQEHCRTVRRTIHIANLDPAAENFEYDAAFDVKDLITLESAMDEFGYGPNGGLVYCMEYLQRNSDWLRDNIDEFSEDDYIILDCPGQIELYSHLPIMKDIADMLQSWGLRVVVVNLLDALFALEPVKFVSGCMLSLSCMIRLELPYVNVMTKCDIADKEQVERVLEAEGAWMVNSLDRQTPEHFKRFSRAISAVIDDYMMVAFVMLDVTEEESIEQVMAVTDNILQYGEEIEPKELVEEENLEEMY